MYIKYYCIFIILLCSNVSKACTACAAQNQSSSLNMSLIPLAILVCIPFMVFSFSIIQLLRTNGKSISLKKRRE